MKTSQNQLESEIRWGGGSLPILIVGPTAVGKTDVAIELAERINGEIVNADSMQIYSGMDTGTAKPDAAARHRVPFHLLDLVQPDQRFSVSEWKLRAELAIHEIAVRGRIPIICGGTGLYVRALVDDWTLAETAADMRIRDRLQREAEELGSSILHSRLATVDPAAAARLHPNDTVRIIRALEVFALTGIPITEYQSRDRQARLQRRVLKFGLTLPRPQLYDRINARVDAMIAQGLEEEVAHLLKRGISPDSGPMRSLGYKEMCAFLRGELDRQTAIETIKLNTRRFSKRQQTWFRADPQIQWIDVTALDSATVAQQIRRMISERQQSFS